MSSIFAHPPGLPVTVVIPVYNGSDYIRDSIGSVLNQTYQDFELIVVDDGSTDETVELVKAFGDQVLCIEQPNGGVAEALNTGIRNARGAYIAWLSHDDRFLPEKLERQMAYMADQPDLMASFTHFELIDEHGHVHGVTRPQWHSREDGLKRMFYDMYINGCTMLMKRECFERCGLFRREFRYSQDAAMWMKFYSQFDIGCLPEALTQYRCHPKQGSRAEPKFVTDVQAMQRAMFDEIDLPAWFRDSSDSDDSPRPRARALNWLAFAAADKNQWYEFSDGLLNESASLWPSGANPAVWARLIGAYWLFEPRRLPRRAYEKLMLMTGVKPA